jgi:hypothetical protein
MIARRVCGAEVLGGSFLNLLAIISFVIIRANSHRREGHMAAVNRVGPGSAFKIGLVVYAILGLAVAIPFALLGMIAGPLMAKSGLPGAGLGFLGIVVFPICYGLIGGIFAAIGAFIYNLAAGWVGGLEVDLS